MLNIIILTEIPKHIQSESEGKKSVAWNSLLYHIKREHLPLVPVINIKRGFMMHNERADGNSTQREQCNAKVCAGFAKSEIDLGIRSSISTIHIIIALGFS